MASSSFGLRTWPPARAARGFRVCRRARPPVTTLRRSWFAQELTYEGGDAKVVNNLGEFYFRITADPKTGVIDMYAGPTKDDLALFPTRVVALPDGRSAYSFTMFKAPGTPDDLFESQYESLRREFDNIRARFSEDHTSCRA
jgi:hypothetical protein